MVILDTSVGHGASWMSATQNAYGLILLLVLPMLRFSPKTQVDTSKSIEYAAHVYGLLCEYISPQQQC
jgi:hypothetical protein